jgi:signal transduction histidine kinase
MDKKRFSLNLKFSFAVGAIFLGVCAVMSLAIYYYLRSYVIREAENKTMIIMTHVKSTGEYVRETLRPAIFDALHRLNAKDEFIVEAMSTTHVSMQVMKRFNREIKDYVFRRLSDNPRNPANKADFFHLDMLNHFRMNPEEKFWKGIVTLNDKQYLYLIYPVIMDTPCLQCHGDPKDAPAQLIKLYGKTGGFGWKVGNVVGVNSVSVPLDTAFKQIKKLAIDTFLFGFSSLFVMFIAVYFTFNHLITKPINNLSRIFKGITRGNEPLGKAIPINSKDEIGDLTESFNTLSRHLLEAQEKLKKTAELEKRIMEAEKFSVIGQLASGIAHEINNPLGGIRLCFNNLLSTEMDESVKKEHIEVINSGLDRIQNIVKQLLNLSKTSPLTLTKTSINKIIENTLILSEYTISAKGIKIIKDLKPDLPDIFVDPHKLEQVLLNLIINAFQAMEEEGILTIKSWNDDNYCYISISDTGRGIPKEILPKIFDPFFTTKPGEGTGLGLTVSKAIIDQHNGELLVEISDKGSTFIVKLPLVL